MLMALASHYWRPDFSPAQAASLYSDFAEDLSDCLIAEIEVAIREYRRDPANKFFPKSADLRGIIGANRKHRKDLERLGNPIKDFDSRPHFWWGQRRQWWQPHWRESDIPRGELVRDQVTGKLREPQR